MNSHGFTEEDLAEKVATTIAESGDEESSDDASRTLDTNSKNSKQTSESKVKKRKKGIIYVANIPKHMNVTLIREYLGRYGNIGRVYLQPEKLPGADQSKGNRKKRIVRHFTEGWVEFERKRVAKQIASMLNNTQIGTRKRSKFYDSLWSIKYLPRFKWVHLSERLRYEQAVHRQRLLNEVSQARKEANFFQNKLDKSESMKKKNKKLKTSEQG